MTFEGAFLISANDRASFVFAKHTRSSRSIVIIDAEASDPDALDVPAIEPEMSTNDEKVMDVVGSVAA